MIRKRVQSPLWDIGGDQKSGDLDLWKAFLIAFLIEFGIPLMFHFFDWPFTIPQDNPEPTPLMSVRLEEKLAPDSPPVPEVEEIKKKKKNQSLENMEQIPLAPIEPLPNEKISKIQLPKPKPKPEPEEEIIDLPPLPSVFQDIKPVKKVKPKYPREAEDEKIEGRVKVRMKVDLDGTVSGVSLIFSEPEGVFDTVVLEAAKKFIFKQDGTSYYADEVFVFIIDP